jgi:hypothetical protein
MVVGFSFIIFNMEYMDEELGGPAVSALRRAIAVVK